MRPVSRAVKCTLLIFLEKWPLKLLLLMPFPRQPHPFFFSSFSVARLRISPDTGSLRFRQLFVVQADCAFFTYIGGRVQILCSIVAVCFCRV